MNVSTMKTITRKSRTNQTRNRVNLCCDAQTHLHDNLGHDGSFISLWNIYRHQVFHHWQHCTCLHCYCTNFRYCMKINSGSFHRVQTLHILAGLKK